MRSSACPAIVWMVFRSIPARFASVIPLILVGAFSAKQIGLNEHRFRHIDGPKRSMDSLTPVDTGGYATQGKKSVVEGSKGLISTFASNAGNAVFCFHHQLFGMRNAAGVDILAEVHLKNLIEKM